MEIIIAAVAGWVVAYQSWWCDMDEVIAPYWYVVLLGFGFAYGIWGLCRIWIIGAIASWASLYAAVGPMNWAFQFEVAMFFWMFAIILTGGGIGRVVRRYWIKNTAGHSAKVG